jgi:hypothetical protein
MTFRLVEVLVCQIVLVLVMMVMVMVEVVFESD